MPNKITVFTGSVLADAIADELPHSPLGVIADSLPPFDIPTAVEELGNRIKKPIRLALLGEAAATAPKCNTRTPITTSETVANKWRHDSEAIKGQKLVVLAVGPVSKLRSLQSSLTHVTEAKLRRAIRNRAINWSSIEARKVLWEILASDFDRFPTTRLCEFAAEVAQIASHGNKHDVPDYEINNLFRLGLLQNAQLLQEEGPTAIRRLLAANSHLVDRLRAPTKEDKARVGRAAEDDRDSLAATARKLLAFMRSPTLACLEGIEFGQTLRVLAPTPAPPDDVGNPPQPQDTPKQENRLGDELAVEDILETGGENLDDARDHFDPPEGEDPEDEFDFGGRKVVHTERPGRSQTACLLARFFTETTFGAYVEASSCSEYVEALNALAAEETEIIKEFRPRQAADPYALETLLQKIVKRGLPKVCQDVLTVWSRHLELRSQLLPHASELVDHPLLSLCQDDNLLNTADQLVKNYGLLAKQIDDVRKAIETDSPESAKRLVSKLLSTDVVFLKLRASAFVAIAGPTHPFHLWRWVETAKLLKSNREELAKLDRDLVVKLASNPPVSSPHLLLTPHIEGVAKETVFLAVGAIAALPLYSDPESRTAARFHVKGLAEVADKLLASAPHAANGFEVVAIDPPSPVDLFHALEDLSPAYSTESSIPVHLRILRTRKAPAMLDEEDESMDSQYASATNSPQSSPGWKV